MGSSPGLDRRLRDMEARLEGPDRHVDVALALRRDKTKETLLYAGGRWDRVEKRFSCSTDVEVAVVDLEESEVEFTRWFAEQLRDFRDGFPREIALALVAGARRGGKTFTAYFCQVAALVDVPLLRDGLPAVGWTISRTFRHRDELDSLLAGYVPSAMYAVRKAPEHRFTFAHGSYLRNLSAEDPDSLKQGRVDWLLYNEAQLMSARAVKNGMYGTADRGGLTVLAANPPSPGQAEWLVDLKESIEDDPEVRPITKFFNFDPAKNTKVDQPARKRVAKLAHQIEPEGAEADAEGEWGRWGEMAYPAWNPRPFERGGNVWAAEEHPHVDVTTQMTRREFGEPYAFVVGADFQRKPEAAAVLRILEVPGIVGNVYYFDDDCGTNGTEVDLSTDLLGAPHSYTQRANGERSAVWVGDCSGSYQGAERIKGRTSFGLLEAEGWRVFAAETIRLEGRSEHPKNPDVMQRLGLMQRLMGNTDAARGQVTPRRILVHPRCEWLRQAFAKCELRKTDAGRRVPKGRWAHVSDAACYPIWRLEPKPGKIYTAKVLAAEVRSMPQPERRLRYL